MSTGISEVEQSLQDKIVAMENNQGGLIKENEGLRTIVETLQKGKAIYGKMLAIKNEIGSIGKDQKNTFQGFKFRGIDQFINAVHPLLNKHGVGVSTKVLQYSDESKTNDKGKTSKNVRMIMEYTFYAEDGSNISTSMPAEGIDTSDKATNKALSAALKYALIQTLFVPTVDMEIPDSESVQQNGEELKGAKKAEKPVAKAAAKKDGGSFRKKKATESTGSSNVEL